MERKQKLIKYLKDNLRPYLTKEEWEEMLPKYIENYFKGYPVATEVFKNPIEPEEILTKGFIWLSSLEGNEYWENLWEKVVSRHGEIPIM